MQLMDSDRASYHSVTTPSPNQTDLSPLVSVSSSLPPPSPPFIALRPKQKEAGSSSKPHNMETLALAFTEIESVLDYPQISSLIARITLLSSDRAVWGHLDS